MTLLAKSRINRLPAIVSRLDRPDQPPMAPLHAFGDSRVSTRNVTLRHFA